MILIYESCNTNHKLHAKEFKENNINIRNQERDRNNKLKGIYE